MLLSQIVQVNEWWLFPWIFLIPLVWFVIGILILFWVYQDAESHGMSGLLWAIIVFFLNIIGLILYLVVREGKVIPVQRINRVCPQCGQVLGENAKFCPRCGKELA